MLLEPNWQPMSVTISSLADDAPTVRNDSLFRRAWYDRALPKEIVAAVTRGNIERLLQESRPLQVKDRCVVGLHERTAAPLLIKRHSWGEWHRTIRMAFRESAAHHCARVGKYLHEAGLPTPQSRAEVEYHIGPWAYCSYLITDFIPGDSLYRFIRFQSHDRETLRYIARQVAEIWQRLVTLGVSHNDFKPENFIVGEDRRVWLIDLEKVHLRDRAVRQQQRQIFDVRNLLHIRNWHDRAEARAIFAEAFLQAPNGVWFRSTDVERVAQGGKLKDNECDASLSVVFVSPNHEDVVSPQPGIGSVRDIADEALLVSLDESAQLSVLDRISFTQLRNTKDVDHATKSQRLSALVRHPWVLLLNANEHITPVLAKDLQQRIARTDGASAYTAEIELLYFGCSVERVRANPPVRLFRHSDFTLSVDQHGGHVLPADATAGRMIGTIQATEFAEISEMIAALNEQSSQSARMRVTTGERAKLLRTAARSFAKFLSKAVRSVSHGGWSGIQVAALQSIFTWLEEAKLDHLARHPGCDRPSTTNQVDAAKNRSGKQTVLTQTRAA